MSKHATLRRRILLVVGTLLPGGIERQASDLAKALQRTGVWEPSVCCILDKVGPFVRVLEDYGILVHECPLSRAALPSFSLRFARLLRSVAPDVVHSHVAFAIPWQLLGIRLARINRVVVTHHNDYRYWRSHPAAHLRIIAYYWLTRPFISSYTVVSDQVRTNFARLVLSSERYFQVIHNPVDLDLFNPAPGLRQAARTMMGIGPKKYVIGTVAALSEQKAQSFLIRALALMVREHRDVHLVLIGDGERRAALEEQVARRGLQESVSFLGRRTDVERLYHGFDCFALSSLWEGFPLAIVEAMACGLPIVATNVGGVSEALDCGRCGLLVPPADSDALAHALSNLCSNPELAATLAANARERAMSYFRVDQTLERYVEIYDKILVSRR